MHSRRQLGHGVNHVRAGSEVKLVSILGKLTAVLLWITRILSYCPSSPLQLLSHKRPVFEYAVIRSTPSSSPPTTSCLSTPSPPTLTPISASFLCPTDSPHHRPHPTSFPKSRKLNCGAHQTSYQRSLVLLLNSSVMLVCSFLSITSFPIY